MKGKIILVTIALHKMAGGLERNIVRIANYLAARGREVHLVSFDTPDAVSFFPIGENVAWHKPGTTPTHQKIGFAERLRLIARVREIIRPENGERTQVICFHHGILARLFLAAFFLDVKILCSERNSLSLYDHIRRDKWNLNFLLLAFATRIIVQFSDYFKDYPRFMRRRLACIPNAIEPARGAARPGEPDGRGRYTLLAAGRLCDQKNYECLLIAFSRLAGSFPLWNLVIAGDGDLHAKLKEHASWLGIGERVSFPGQVKDMETLFMNAHLYCMPSKWEGFPNALAEAMSYGLPAVGFKGCSGVRNLINNSAGGLLAEGNGNTGTLAASLHALMSDPEKRVLMGALAAKSMQQYAPEAVLPLWEKVLGEVD